MNDEQLEAYVRNTSAQLSEHFDAVQILVSRVNADGSTSHLSKGHGNFFARIGMAQNFIDADVAETQAIVINRIDNESN